MNNWFKELKDQAESTDIVWNRSRNYKIVFEAYSYIKSILDLVEEQALDEGIWFHYETASEAYLMQELRRLHKIIENKLVESSL